MYYFSRPPVHITLCSCASRGRFHKSWAQGAKHRDSSIKVGRMAQSALNAFKKLLKSWAYGANKAQNSYEIDPKSLFVQPK